MGANRGGGEVISDFYFPLKLLPVTTNGFKLGWLTPTIAVRDGEMSDGLPFVYSSREDWFVDLEELRRPISLRDHWPAPDALIRTNVLAIQRNELCMAV